MSESTFGKIVEDRIPENRFYRVYRISATALSLIILCGLTIYIFIDSFETATLYSWHPSFLTLGFLFLMAEAMLVLTKDNIITFFSSNLQKSSRLHHYILQAGAAICNIVGLVTIFCNKEEGGRRHFVSDHAIVGLVAIICCLVTCANGVITMYAIKLKNWIKPSLNKVLHITLGIITFVLGIAAEGTGFFTSAFRVSSSIKITCTVLMALASLVILEGAIRSAYLRMKPLIFKN